MKRRIFMVALSAIPLITYGTPGLLWGRWPWPIKHELQPIVTRKGTFDMFIEIAWRGTFDRDDGECPIYVGLDHREMRNNSLVGVAYYDSGEHQYGPTPLSRVFGGVLPDRFHIYTPNMRQAKITIQNVIAVNDEQGWTTVQFGKREQYWT